eukprot:m.129202 g.129202  ORF g.129202 m.129202 type:complete len:387 (-) comp9765_c0_seq6:1445-2605(-)
MFEVALGHFTYGAPAPVTNSNPPMTTATMFDLASLTKVVATTTAAMTLYQTGFLDLDEPVSSARLLGPAFAAQGKGNITVRNLLLHNAGFPPDPNPEFWFPAFGCPESSKYHPEENFSCQGAIFRGVLNQTLSHAPGTKYVYSDLSMITMMYVIGAIVRNHKLVTTDLLRPTCVGSQSDHTGEEQCFYDAYVNLYVLDPALMFASGFLPDPAVWSNIAPTWNDTDTYSPGPAYRHRVIQGQVSDGNSYALGGIAGHAGLFSDVGDLFSLMQKLMFAADADPWINATTVKTFTTIYNVTQSSRALGWDTNSYVANTYRGCANLSETTYTHTGYTGTEICNDPERKIITILLTNRVYPRADEESLEKIHTARQRFNNAVKGVLDALGF